MSGTPIFHFMWGYQEIFRIVLRNKASNLLKSVSPELSANALLVGVGIPGEFNGPAACLEPEREEISPSAFYACASRVEEIGAAHPLHHVFYGDEPSTRDKPERIRRGSVRQAVLEVLDTLDAVHGTKSFAGFPERVNGYHVIPVLQLPRAAYDATPHFDTLVQWDRWTAPLGFVDALVMCLLGEATRALGEREPGRFVMDTLPLDPPALLRQAGESLCSSIWLTTKDIESQNAFDQVNRISALRYESSAGRGRLVFAPADHPSILYEVRFASPVPIHEAAWARKVMQMTRGDLCAIARGPRLDGLGHIADPMADGVLVVELLDHQQWRLVTKSTVLMVVSYGVPGLPVPRLTQAQFESNFLRIFETSSDADVSAAWALVVAAMRQSHGTMIVVSAEAASEATRLARQGTPISATRLDGVVVDRVTSIDGAVLVDPAGTCHAIGVILDGLATDAGDPSRGARFNSAVRYVASAGHRSLALVVSEDGRVDMIPTLRPRLRRGDIQRNIELLRRATPNTCHALRNWLDAHRFYLTQDQCDAVNTEFERINSAPDEVGAICILLPRFAPHPDLDDSYFEPEPVPVGPAGDGARPECSRKPSGSEVY